jgi:hypothetical protein
VLEACRNKLPMERAFHSIQTQRHKTALKPLEMSIIAMLKKDYGVADATWGSALFLPCVATDIRSIFQEMYPYGACGDVVNIERRVNGTEALYDEG